MQRSLKLVLSAAALVASASPALAQDAVTTRLVSCKSGDCLLVSGHRDPGSAVHINGNRVHVEGRAKWQVSLPVETVRAWSVPYARTIEVAYRDADSDEVLLARPLLPIGLLGHAANLAALVVRVN